MKKKKKKYYKEKINSQKINQSLQKTITNKKIRKRKWKSIKIRNKFRISKMLFKMLNKPKKQDK